MKSAKRYTNQTFTKRVDHEGGSHRGAYKLPEPAFCPECSAVYSGGRWAVKAAGPRPEIFSSATCPACKQMESGVFGGYVSIGGDFAKAHKDEIESLVKNEARRAIEDNPLSRIMQHRERDGELTYKTTTEHLAERLGRALKKAYDGEVAYTFSHENKVVRVSWHRD